MKDDRTGCMARDEQKCRAMKAWQQTADERRGGFNQTLVDKQKGLAEGSRKQQTGKCADKSAEKEAVVCCATERTVLTERGRG